MPKMDYFTYFLSKNVYNDVLCINGSKVTALNIFYHSMFTSPLTECYLLKIALWKVIESFLNDGYLL